MPPIDRNSENVSITVGTDDDGPITLGSFEVSIEDFTVETTDFEWNYQELHRAAQNSEYGRRAFESSRHTVQSDEATDIITKLVRWKNLGKDRIGDFDPGKPIQHMDTPTIDAWFYDHAQDTFGTDEVKDAFVGETYDDASGIDAVRHLVLEDASETIDTRIGDGQECVVAFNRTTSSWPHKARAYLAGYEANYAIHGTESYQRDVTDFASTEGLADYAPGQTTLDFYAGDNPFDSDDLTDEEASTVVLMSACEHDDIDYDEVLDDVEHHDTFRTWLKKTGEVESALRAHYFDGVLPDDLVAELAPPEEWDDLDPLDVEKKKCDNCNDTYYRVHHHEEGRVWLHKNGSSVTESFSEVSDPDAETEMYALDGTNHIDAMCSQCREEWFENASDVTLYAPDGSMVGVKYNRGVALDRGYGDDDFPDRTRHDASNEARRLVMQFIQNVPSNYFELRPNSSVADVVAQQAALESLVDGDGDFEADINEPLAVHRVFHFDDREYYFRVPRDDPETAAAGKRVLENPTNYVSA